MYITLDNHKTYYEVSGIGKPLLLIHGLGSNTKGWKYQVDFFSKYYKVYVYDVRGHGKSNRNNQKYSINQFSNDLFLFINSVIGQPTNIVGMSMGGIIAFQLAIDHPEIILTLSIINSIPEFKIDNFYLKFKLWSRIFVTKLLGMKVIGKMLSKQLLRGEKYDQLKDLFIDEWSQNDKHSYLNSIKAMIGWSIAERLHEIKFPILMVSSEFDYVPVSLKKYYIDKMRNAELVVINNTRHALPIEKPVELNSAIFSFLKRNNQHPK